MRFVLQINMDSKTLARIESRLKFRSFLLNFRWNCEQQSELKGASSIACVPPINVAFDYVYLFVLCLLHCLFQYLVGISYCV